MHRMILSVSALFVAAALLCPPAQAASFPEAMFILDASGSMQDAAGNETRIAAAKRVLRQVVPRLPPEVRVGLAAYGHRRDKDCDDVEVLMPPGSDQRDQLLSSVDALQPKGMTPICAAVTRVADGLKGRDAETTIVLVSDGQETCGGDPCAVVRALKAAGVKFILHVVGFGVSPLVKQELACMADAGGGQYFGAQDAASLLAALNSVGAEIEQKVEKAKATVVQRKTGLGKLRIQVPESAVRAVASIRITRKSDGKTIKESEFSQADSTHPLLSGDYELTLLFANPNYQPPTPVSAGPFAIEGGQTTALRFGSINFNIADAFEDMSIASVIITPRGADTPYLVTQPHGNDYYLFKPKAVPAGHYQVRIEYYRSPAPFLVADDIAVEAMADAHVTLDAGIRLAEPESGGVTGWDLVPSGGGDALHVRRGRDNDIPLWRSFLVPPGAYDLLLHVDGMEEPLPAAQAMEIKNGELLSFDTGL